MTRHTLERQRSQVYAALWVSEASRLEIVSFFAKQFGVSRKQIQSRLHLTVYQSGTPLAELRIGTKPVSITIDAPETRFMVLAPGGENPRDNLDAQSLEVGIRLPKRNQAIPNIQRLRESLYRLETPESLEGRRPTSTWKSAFGSPHYQPHIQLLRSGHQIGMDLTEVGALFRSSIATIGLDRFEVSERDAPNNSSLVRPPSASHRTGYPAISPRQAAQLKDSLLRSSLKGVGENQ